MIDQGTVREDRLREEPQPEMEITPPVREAAPTTRAKERAAVFPPATATDATLCPFGLSAAAATDERCELCAFNQMCGRF